MKINSVHDIARLLRGLELTGRRGREAGRESGREGGWKEKRDAIKDDTRKNCSRER